MRIDTRLSVGAAEVAAAWNDVGAAGLTARADALIDGDGFRLMDGAAVIDLAEVGTSFTDLRVDFSMPSTQQVDVSRLTFNVLGGALATRPFSYDLTA
ncbi:MAG: hypothetical protein AAGA61_03300, partial [Pseudomonadota bacterium]